MKITIELDIDIYHDDNELYIDDLIADWTYEMRTNRRLRSWDIKYDNPYR